jgi:bifunctional non-homologous end joining protein LigD
MIWDRGTYAPEGADDVEGALRAGHLKFTLKGKKLKGSWVLVHTRGRNWLLIKHRDRYAQADDVTETAPMSVVSKRLLRDIAADEGGDVDKAAAADPRPRPRGPRR